LFKLALINLLIIIFASCATGLFEYDDYNETYFINYNEYILSSLVNANIPNDIYENIYKEINTDNNFINDLLFILNTDPHLYILIDKEHSITEEYNPQDLISLNNASFEVTRNDLYLRYETYLALEEMAAAAREDGVRLIAASAYRSVEYQRNLFNRYVTQMGQREAERVSARAGHSQHHLGSTVDFYPISSAFSRTAENRWLLQNAAVYGFSLSYPEGLEHITGYIYESWHYRYVGARLAVFINTYFNGIQQYALKFIHEYQLLIKTMESLVD